MKRLLFGLLIAILVWGGSLKERFYEGVDRGMKEIWYELEGALRSPYPGFDILNRWKVEPIDFLKVMMTKNLVVRTEIRQKIDETTDDQELGYLWGVWAVQQNCQIEVRKIYRKWLLEASEGLAMTPNMEDLMDILADVCEMEYKKYKSAPLAYKNRLWQLYKKKVLKLKSPSKKGGNK
ncbi:MAG: hypothetical protein ABIL02_05935 [candidate division WOR-3 bacterium]